MNENTSRLQLIRFYSYFRAFIIIYLVRKNCIEIHCLVVKSILSVTDSGATNTKTRIAGCGMAVT